MEGRAAQGSSGVGPRGTLGRDKALDSNGFMVRSLTVQGDLAGCVNSRKSYRVDSLPITAILHVSPTRELVMIRIDRSFQLNLLKLFMSILRNGRILN